MKKVYLVHGWGGNPKNAWFPWLKKELEKRNFKVESLNMPNPDEPEIMSWVGHLKKIINNPNKETYFVGHSIGCQTIMRFLEKLPKYKKIGGCVFVAGWFNLNHLETKEEKEIAESWLKNPINTDKIKSISPKFVTIFSDDDPDVDIDDSELFKKRLKAEIILEHNKGHFSDDAGVKELPIVLTKILEMAK